MERSRSQLDEARAAGIEETEKEFGDELEYLEIDLKGWVERCEGISCRFP